MSSEFKGKEQRAICYAARDAYFECAEKQPAGTDNKVACKDLFAKFESTCGSKWVEHFIRRKDYLKFKEELQKSGADAVDEARLKSKGR